MVALATGWAATASPLGIVWTALTALVMFTLAIGKSRVGRALDDPVLRTEGRVTLVDGILATSVLVGLVVTATTGWRGADIIVALLIAGYAGREAFVLLR